jgi:hypothetical protein
MRKMTNIWIFFACHGDEGVLYPQFKRWSDEGLEHAQDANHRHQPYKEREIHRYQDLAVQLQLGAKP